MRLFLPLPCFVCDGEDVEGNDKLGNNKQITFLLHSTNLCHFAVPSIQIQTFYVWFQIFPLRFAIASLLLRHQLAVPSKSLLAFAAVTQKGQRFEFSARLVGVDRRYFCKFHRLQIGFLLQRCLPAEDLFLPHFHFSNPFRKFCSLHSDNVIGNSFNASKNGEEREI